MQHEQLDLLRKQAQQHREANNAIVDQIWEIDLSLAEHGLAKDIRELMQKERNKLQIQMKNEDHLKIYNDLLAQIRQLETELQQDSNDKSQSS